MKSIQVPRLLFLISIIIFAFIAPMGLAAQAIPSTPVLVPILDEAGAWGFMSERGAIAIVPEYQEVRAFAGGYAAVKLKGLWGYIDTKGKRVIAPSFELARDFSQGLAPVKKGGVWLFINEQGKAPFKATWNDAYSYAEGYARVLKGKLWGFVDINGYLSAPIAFQEAKDFSSGFALVKKAGIPQFIDTKGIRAFSSIAFIDAKPFSEGMAAIKVGKLWGYIDSSGAMRITPAFDDALGFSLSLAPVKTGGLWGYIDRSGAMYFAAVFDEALPFSEGLGSVRKKDRWGAIDIYGRLAIYMQHRSGFQLHGDIARISGETAKDFYYINGKGSIVTPGGREPGAFSYDFKTDYANFTPSSSWAQSGSVVRFRDNDPTSFRTLWCKANVYNEYEFHSKIAYIGGLEDQGFGIVFNFSDSANYWSFEINHLGFFRLSAKENGTWSDRVSWKKSANIDKVQNELSVRIGQYAVECFINGNLVASAALGSVARGYVNIGLGSAGAVQIDAQSFSYRELDPGESGLIGQRPVTFAYGFDTPTSGLVAPASFSSAESSLRYAMLPNTIPTPSASASASASTSTEIPIVGPRVPELALSNENLSTEHEVSALVENDSPGSDSGVGIVFRYLNERSYYTLLIYTDRSFAVTKWENSQAKPIFERKASDKLSGKAQTIKVVNSRMGWAAYADNALIASQAEPLADDEYLQAGIACDASAIGLFKSMLISEAPALGGPNRFDTQGRLVLAPGNLNFASNPHGFGEGTFFRVVSDELEFQGRYDGQFSVDTFEGLLDPMKGISVKARFDSGDPLSGFGLVFRYANRDDFYFFEMNGEGKFRLARSVREGWTEIKGLTAVPGVKPGEWAELRVRFDNEGKLECLVNGKSLYSVSIDAPAATALRAGVGSGATAKCRFREFAFE